MSKNLKLTAACLAGVLAPWLFAMAPAAADEQFAPTAVVQLPDTQILSAFDISFVEPQTRTLAIAASRVVGSGGTPFGTVIIVNTQTNLVTKELHASPPFVGDCTVPPIRNNFSGPNGVIVVEKGRNADVWVGDGPVFNTPCVPTSGLKTPSTVKVLDLHTGATKAVIPTGTGAGTKTPGIRRADELCYNPRSDVVLMANDDPLDNFITFIQEDSFKVLQRIRFDGTDPNGDNILANGIEQCAFNPRDGKFYLNIPATGTTASPGPGLVLTISEHAPFHVERVFTIDPVATGCKGPNGLAVGPSNQMALGCGGANSLIINSTNGNPVATVTGEGGTDEAWYNPTANQYYFARSAAAVLGVEDAGPPPTAASTNNTPTAVGSHSVAADSNKNAPSNKSQVYVPIRTGVLSPTATICASKGGNNTYGCVAVFDAP